PAQAHACGSSFTADEDRRKTTARRPEVGGLSLVKTGGDQLNLAGVGIISQVCLHAPNLTIYRDRPGARWNNLLGHVIRSQDLVPYLAGDLVATIGRLAAETRTRLEEQLVTSAPQFVRVGKHHHLSPRYPVKQRRDQFLG